MDSVDMDLEKLELSILLPGMIPLLWKPVWKFIINPVMPFLGLDPRDMKIWPTHNWSLNAHTRTDYFPNEVLCT